MYHLDFDADAKEYAQWNIAMPSDWDADVVTAKFYWTAAAGAAGNVIWGLQGISYGDDDAIDQAWGAAAEVADAWIANGDEHITAATASITLAGTPAAEEDVQFRAYRDGASGSDTMVNDARLIKIKVTFTRT